MDDAYDIYIAAHVDEMKAENERLRIRVAELTVENAELCRQLDGRRRRAAYGDDYEWMNGD